MSRSKNQFIILLEEIKELVKKNDNKLLSFKEAGSYLGFSTNYLYRLTYQNLIPHYKPTGKTIFFFKNELDEWIRAGNVKSETGEEAIKDPNQLGMFETETGPLDLARGKDRKRKGKELLIEFPLKKRRGKKQTDFISQQSENK